MKVPVTKPYIGEEEKKAVCDVLESGWLVQGQKVLEFEKAVCDFTGATFARASTNCTTALHLALIALGIGPGDEFLLPSFTYIASANAIEYTGARPVFVDIDLRTFNIDPAKIEQHLKWTTPGSKVKGIMPVHLFGLVADMGAIMELSKEHDLFLVEDAANALGSLYKSKHAGTFGNAGCFSFHPRKPVTTGEGGMVTTGSQEFATKIESLRDHGASISDMARHEKQGYLLPSFNVLGYNYRMTDIQGAIGIEQMKKFPWMLEQRIKRAKRYNEELKDIKWLQTPYIPDGCDHTYQSYVTLIQNPKYKNLILDNINELNRFRNKVMVDLEEKGIATRQGTHAVHTLTYYKKKYNLKDEDYINSIAADRLSMTLPLYPQMTDEEQGYVIDNLKRVNRDYFG
ncbi:DegT/DnrJ/EryC1/StrS family aminotransferase [Chloroflexota bacterium]